MVWLLCWAPGQEVALHDHGGASGAFVVTHGLLREAYVSGAALRRRVCVPGMVRRVPPQRIHTVWNPGPHPAVSLHAYSPPLTAMTFYTPPGGGQALRPVHAERVGEELR
jgi:predicted metal-dependent enzyme (double-stranded beta helix superfamily)